MQIYAPLSVLYTKNKKFILNLNQYRNAHYFTLNNAKAEYKLQIASQLEGLSFINPIQITYTLYPKTRRRTDLGNVLSIHQKFFEDSLTELGCIADDDYKHITHTLYKFGSVDPGNPRVVIDISENEDVYQTIK